MSDTSVTENGGNVQRRTDLDIAADMMWDSIERIRGLHPDALLTTKWVLDRIVADLQGVKHE